MSANIIRFPGAAEPPVDREATLEETARRYYRQAVEDLQLSDSTLITALFLTVDPDEKERLVQLLEARGIPRRTIAIAPEPPAFVTPERPRPPAWLRIVAAAGFVLAVLAAVVVMLTAGGQLG